MENSFGSFNNNSLYNSNSANVNMDINLVINPTSKVKINKQVKSKVNFQKEVTPQLEINSNVFNLSVLEEKK